MLVDPAFLLANMGRVFALSTLIVAGKAAISVCILLRQPLQTALRGRDGPSARSGSFRSSSATPECIWRWCADQYALILAGALVSISVNPLVFRAIGPLERALRRLGP